MKDALASTITTDCLTEGDIIKHFTGDIWQVISKPQYTKQGIRFEVILFEENYSPDNIQTVCFAPDWKFELIGYQPVIATA